MSYSNDLKIALKEELGPQVKFWKGWKRKKPIGTWKTKTGKPVALVLHHTGGAATSSKNPDDYGNQTGSNNGQVKFVSNHPQYNMPCSQFCLDRDGTVYVFSAEPVYHAGAGDFSRSLFTRKKWGSLGVSRNAGNTTMLGVEIVSKGAKDDLTQAQWDSLAKLARACAKASGWGVLGAKHLPRHKDYAGPRKVDLKATRRKIARKLGL